MPLTHPPAARRCFVLVSFFLVTCAASLSLAPPPAEATFHLNQITKIMAGYEGDEAIEAVEMEMMLDGENLVSGGSLKVYNANGVLVSTLGTFGSNLPASGAFAGRKILFATMKWKQKFGLTPDLQISAGIPKLTGQVSFELPGCVVNAIAYGAVNNVLNGPSSALQLPILGATALIRGVGNATFPSCPLGENAGAWFGMIQGYPGHPIRFTNNAGQFVDVTSIVTAVEPTAEAPRPLRASPNPFQGATTIEFASAPGRVTVHDVQGRLVRAWDAGAGTGNQKLQWDGTDARGRAVPAGIYFVRALGSESKGAPPLRIVLLR